MTGLPDDIGDTVRRALAEDVGDGDLSAGLVPEDARACAAVVSREPAVLCGAAWFDEVFRQLDPGVRTEWRRRDGDPLEPGQAVCRVEGPARALLTGERAALNFLQTLSGTATLARQYADAVRGLAITVLDTRKTVPGLRAAQKYAVRCGGCANHRMGLYDAFLIKENHILAAGSIAAAIAAARNLADGRMIEVEVETVGEAAAAVAAGADRLLLDNFDAAMIREAVERVAGRAALEVSGNVTLDALPEIAASGVDFVSVGALTKHVRAIDFSMRFADNG